MTTSTAPPQHPAMANQPRREVGPEVDERRRSREERAHEQPHRDRDLEAGAALREEDALRSEGVEAHEAARRHERQRQEQDAGVSAPLGRLARRVAERERDPADDAEDQEVRLVVVELGIELRAEEQRDEPDQGQEDREQPGDDDRRRASRRACSRSCPSQRVTATDSV